MGQGIDRRDSCDRPTDRKSDSLARPCPRCAAPNRPTAKFCAKCGAAFGVPCGNCGTPAGSDDRFCIECGLPLGITGPAFDAGPADDAGLAAAVVVPPPAATEPVAPAAPDATAPPPPPAPAPPAAPDAEAAGARRTVTILFADLSGFTAWSEKEDPERVRADLEALLSEIAGAVEASGGTVDKYIGDSAMAVFGYPQAHEDDAVRAAIAAIRMRDAVDRVAAERNLPVRLKVGIHTGSVVAAPVGAGEARRRTVLGDAVNVAARLQNRAGPSQIVASQAVYDAAPKRFEWRKLEPIALKGREAPVLIYDLIRERPAAEAGRERRAPLVGRSVELDLLERAVRLADEGEGQIVTLIGEAGIGKSRLIYELCETRLNRWSGLFSAGRALAYARTTAYQAFRDAMPNLLGLGAADPAAEAAGRLREAVAALDLPAEIAPAVAPVVGIDLRDAAFDALAPEEKRRRTIEAAIEIVLARARRGPVCLRLEDLHWIDPASRALLAALAPRIRGGRVAILAIGRPGFAPPWPTECPHTQIVLRDLGRADIRQMARAIVFGPGAPADATLPAEVEKAIEDRSGGNPLFAEEIVAAFIESGVLVPDDGAVGAWRLGRPVAEAAVPQTLQGILLSRYDRLPPEARRALAAASVLGRFFAGADLAAVLGAGAAAMLEPATEAEIVIVRTTFPRREYVFKHVLAQEAIYSNLLADDRARLHLAAARALGGEGEVHSDRAEAVSYHYLRSTEPARAIPWLVAAGNRASDLYTHDVAIEHFRTAAETALKADRFPDAAEALILLGRSRDMTGDLKTAVEEFRRAASIADENRIPAMAGRTRYEMGRLLRRLGDLPAAEENLRAALVAAVGLGDRRLEAEAANHLGGLLLDRNEESEAEKVFAQGRAAAEAGYARLVPYFMNRRAEILIRRGAIDEARALLLEAIEINRGYGDRRSEAYGLRILGSIAFRRGDFAGAVERYEDSLRIHLEMGDRAGECWALANLAAVKLRLGRLAEAVEHGTRALDLARQIGFRVAEVDLLGTLASAERRSGRLAVALEMEKRAHSIVQEIGDKQRIAPQALRLATAYKDAGIFAEARRRYAEAVEAASASGDFETEARALLPLANIAQDRGRYREAIENVDRSIEIAREKGLAVHESFCSTTYVRLAGDMGDVEGVDRHARRAMKLVERLGYDDLEPWALVCEARRLTLARDGAAAAERCREAINTAERLGYKRFLVVGYYELGLATFFGEDPSARSQLEHLETAFRLAEEIGEKAELPHIAIHLAANLIHAGRDADRARALLDRCLAITEPQGFRRHVWRARRHLAALDRTTGREAEAVENEAAAVALLGEILDEMPAERLERYLEFGGRRRYLIEAAGRLCEAGRADAVECVERYIRQAGARPAS